MKEKAIQLRAFLLANPDVFAMVGDRIIPVIAKDTAMPFIIYSVSSEPLTKDARSYSGLITLYFEGDQYTEMVGFADDLVDILNPVYDVGSVETGYSEAYATMSTNIDIDLN